MHEPILRYLARISEPQSGCLHTQQLHAAEISDDQIRSLVTRGALTRVCTTVYLFGSTRLSDDALLRAACLRAGPGARLAEQTALTVLGLAPPDPSRVVVWIPRRSKTTATTVRLTTLAPTVETGQPATVEFRARRRLGSVQRVEDLPVSDPIDALVGLASRGNSTVLVRAWREADFRSLLSVEAVEARLGRGIEGSSVIRELLERYPIVGADTTLLSRAERRLLGGITRRRLGQPAVNRPVEFAGQILRPDLFYFDEQLAVEVLGAGHDSPARQLEDLERIRLMHSVGVEVLELSDVEVWRDLEACLDHLEARLRERRAKRQAAA